MSNSDWADKATTAFEAADGVLRNARIDTSEKHDQAVPIALIGIGYAILATGKAIAGRPPR